MLVIGRIEVGSEQVLVPMLVSVFVVCKKHNRVAECLN